MRAFAVFIFIFSKSLYSYTPGFKTFPIKSYTSLTTYYLQPVKKNAEQNFLVVKCVSTKKTLKPFCKVFSSIYFSLSKLETLAINLEEWDTYYLGLDIAIFFGAFSHKIRTWIWRTPIGRIVGGLVLAVEINDFAVQRKQSVAYSVIYQIDQKQAEIKQIQNLLPNFSEKIKAVLDEEKRGALLPNKFWIPLKGFDENLVNKLLDLFDNI